VNFEISGEIYTDDLRVPPLLIQPIIENAFKHGLLHVKKGNQKENKRDSVFRHKVEALPKGAKAIYFHTYEDKFF
jgi:LytS/YehU family sensor histidine kinase